MKYKYWDVCIVLIVLDLIAVAVDSVKLRCVHCVDCFGLDCSCCWWLACYTLRQTHWMVTCVFQCCVAASVLALKHFTNFTEGTANVRPISGNFGSQLQGNKECHFNGVTNVSWFGLAVRHYAGKQRDLNSNPLWLSFLFKSCVVCGHCLVTLSLTITHFQLVKH